MIESTKQKLVASLTTRLSTEINPRNPVKFLKETDVEFLVDSAISVLYLYTRMKKSTTQKSALMAEVICTIGHAIRAKYKLRKDSGLAAKAGAFILWSFEQHGIVNVELGRAANNHQTFIVHVLHDDVLQFLWETLTSEKIEKLPSETPYASWTSGKHELGIPLVKTSNKDVLDVLTPESHPLVFKCINQAQATGWRINEDVLNIYEWALRNKTDAFSDIWDLHNPEAKASKLREAKTIGSIAKRFVDKTFYHLYYLDFRGRKYPATAYLHEQGSDLAKGLLLRADSAPIGKQGFFWLCISIASNWAGDAGRDDGLKTDKIPLNERVYWTLDNEEIILSYAESPKVNQGWMKADAPWQFIAACYELKKFRDWQLLAGIDPNDDSEDAYAYCSHLEAFIDGSNNGSQHLAALTRDEITAPHVNLVPQALPGDLYKYVADYVWEEVKANLAALTQKEIEECNRLIDNLADLKSQIAAAPLKSDRRKELIKEIMDFKQGKEKLIGKASAVYWSRITDNKHKRKIVKRGVMTMPYGGTAYGLGQQVIDDARKHGIDMLMSMEHKWGAYMGHIIYTAYSKCSKRPMLLLKVFEDAGKRAEAEGKFLKWIVPMTNFPVIQNYVEGVVKKIWVQYGPPKGEQLSTKYYENTLQLAICFIEETKPSNRKQSQGAAPNAIHSLDAAHLMLIVDRAENPVTTIHDSFGGLLGHMADLYVVVRETFKELYDVNPLDKLLSDIGGDKAMLDIGELDVSLVLDSEYAFA